MQLYAMHVCVWMFVWCSTITSSRWDIRGDPEEGHWRLKLTEGSVFKASVPKAPCYLWTITIHIHVCVWMFVWCSTITSSRWDIRGDPEGGEGCWRIKLTEGLVCKASIAWDHPYYLFTFNHLIHIACVYLVANKDILDIWYLVPWYLWDIALGSFC